MAEAGGAAHQAVAGTAAGELHFLDYRMPAPSNLSPPPPSSPRGPEAPRRSPPGEGRRARMGVWKTVAASARGAALAGLVAHEHAPLLATATASHVRPGCRAHQGALHELVAPQPKPTPVRRQPSRGVHLGRRWVSSAQPIKPQSLPQTLRARARRRSSCGARAGRRWASSDL